MDYLKRTSLATICALTMSIGLADQAKADAEPNLGDIMMVGFDFCPYGWAAANGQLMMISENAALFSLLGTTYGGDGRVTFALPDMRGRVTIGQGNGPGRPQYKAGQKGGSEYKTMTQTTMPPHNHMVNANNLDGDKPGPGGKLLAAAPTGGTGNETIYSTAGPTVQMSSTMIEPSGDNGAIYTIDPFLTLTYCIAVQGVYPSRS